MAGPTPLLAAAYRGDRDTVERLLAEGATPCLYEAAALGEAARVRALAPATPAAAGERSPDGWTPLHVAAFHDDASVVEALLAHGADAGAREDEGRTPLAVAEAEGQKQVARRLRGEMP
jgi:uncharacterized protein